ncbi:hypothetical protein [Nocardia aurantia]|uniref:Low molecular weight antigen MTB12-like C-terminal domain-containing protein n=1 Tax=Nocardia aurantia TaxID=2585199 RepID=A0A7K0DSD5_9NOCA|nr:hypothetical protein [Nocardia aurantia]MQY28626.1 hypothetical protein [Nocardia aurantia]
MLVRRFPRVVAAVAAVATAATLAGCGGSSTIANNTGTSPEVRQAVTDTYDRFFSTSIPVEEKPALLENGQAFTQALKDRADSTIAKKSRVTVSDVASTGPDSADVIFTVSFGGLPMLRNRKGGAIRTGGTWKVTQATFCSLLQMQGGAPPVCETGSSTTAAVPSN